MPVLRLPSLPATAGKQHWGNLPGAALSLAIAEAASNAKRFTLLLTADSQSAERLQEELSFFAPELPVLLHAMGWWLFWPSLVLALSSAWGYLRNA